MCSEFTDKLKDNFLEQDHMVESELRRFVKEREVDNEFVMKYGGKNIKRFFALDSAVFKRGALSKKTKELIGLATSLGMRCDDCIKYHLINCKSEGVTDEELEEALAIGLIIGGSITIPSLRLAFKAWDEL
jgi:AhpD family alkylhydroperoxidase